MEGPSATSCPRRPKLDVPGVPLFAKERYDIPVNSFVEIDVVGGQTFIGLVVENPLDTTSPDTINLLNPVGTTKGKSNVSIKGFRSFSNDITAVRIRGIIEKKENERPEKVMLTQIVTTVAEAESVLDAILRRNTKAVSVCGLMEGQVGRFGTLCWICIATNGLLICFDMLSELDKKKDSKFWRLIESKLLAREDIVKIFHNARPLTDYLFHVKAIQMKNIFDTQVIELYIRCHQNRNKMPKSITDIVEGSEYNWSYFPFSKCVERFIPKAILSEEMEFLKQYQHRWYMPPEKSQNPYGKRPIDGDSPYYKCAALILKYLEDVYKAQSVILMSHVTHIMREQTIMLTRGNNTDGLDQPYIPQNVMEKIMEGAPYLSDDRNLDYSF